MLPPSFVNLFIIFALLGVGQALFLVLLLLGFRQKDQLPNFFLSILLIDFSIGLLGTTLGASGYYEKWPHLIRVAEPFVFMYGPLLYLYVRSLTKNLISWRSLLHFIPFVLALIITIPFFLKSGPEKIAFVESYFKQPELIPEAFGIVTIRLFHLLTYILLSFYLLKKYKAQLLNQFSNIEKISFDWLRKLLIGFAILVGASWLMYSLILGGWISLLDSNIISSALVAIVIYTIGYMGFRHMRLRMEAKYAHLEPLTEAPVSLKVPESPFDETHTLRVQKKLNELMNDQKLYTQPDLSLKSLAEQVGIQAYQLSQFLNRELNQTFFDYVNQYRIEEVKRLLASPSQKQYTIFALAMDAGFNSKSSFNEAFKRYTGKTPSAYRKESFVSS